MSTFDAPDRETCVVRRARTNTPLQALVLMNDPTYVEAARKLAERLLVEEADPQKRWSRLYRIVLTREPADDEISVLNDMLTAAADRFAQHPDQATELLKVGQSPVNAELNPQQLAAWTTVCSVVLNLDEAITRP